MISDEEQAALFAVFRTGDVDGALVAHIPNVPKGESVHDRGKRRAYWDNLRQDPSAKEYLQYLREEAATYGAVTLGEHIAGLASDMSRANIAIDRMSTMWGGTPGTPAATASLFGTVAKLRELEAKASGLHNRRETFRDDTPGDGAEARGIRVEWV